MVDAARHGRYRSRDVNAGVTRMTGTRAHRFCTLLLGMLVVVGAFGCRSTVDGIATPPTDPDAYPNGDLLVSAEWLHAHASDPEIRLVDLSPLHTYKRGHLPGAVHLWWQDTIEVHNDVYGMLAGAPALEAMIRSAGITPDSTVILYDDAGNRYAARFLWALNAVGFDQVRLLNGGRQAWEAAGFAMTRDRPSPEPGALDIALSYDVLIGADDVQARLNDPSVVIVDNRTPEERAETWFGRLRIGRIPGAVLIPWTALTQPGAVPSYLPPEALSVRFTEAGVTPDRTVIVYGLSGDRAAQTYAALRLLGYPSVKVYDGSWAEWGGSADRPIVPFPEGAG